MLIASAIKGFNREWTAVTSIRDNNQDIIGWRFQTECGTSRSFINQWWNKPHEAAMRAMEDHRCKNAS